MLLAGKPVFVHSLQSFLSTGLIGRVIMTYRDEAQLTKLKAQLAGHLTAAQAVAMGNGRMTAGDTITVFLTDVKP